MKVALLTKDQVRLFATSNPVPSRRSISVWVSATTASAVKVDRQSPSTPLNVVPNEPVSVLLRRSIGSIVPGTRPDRLRLSL